MKPSHRVRAHIVLMLSIVLLLPVAAAGPATAAESTVVAYQSSGWRYKQVAHDADAGFSATSFNDSAFSNGTGGFGSGACPLMEEAATEWQTDTDMLLRRSITMSAGTTGVAIKLAIDNDADVYWNGTQLGERLMSEGCAAHDSIVVPVPSSLVTSANVLAIRAVDRGGDAYVDASVVSGSSTTGQLLTVAATGGTGHVSSSPAGIYECGGTRSASDGPAQCTASYPTDADVTLSATPTSEATLTGWSVAGDAEACPGTDACTVTMSQARTVTATFSSGAGPDTDSDGVPDSTDNCLVNANADQADTDGDTIGDACDVANITIDDMVVGAERDEPDTTVVSVPVRMAEPAEVPVTIGYTLLDRTATGGADFAADSGEVVIPAGEVATSIPVTVIGDNEAEPHEKLAVTLLGQWVLDDDEGLVVIRDDEPTCTFANGTVTVAAAAADITALRWTDAGLAVAPEEVNFPCEAVPADQISAIDVRRRLNNLPVAETVKMSPSASSGAVPPMTLSHPLYRFDLLMGPSNDVVRVGSEGITFTNSGELDVAFERMPSRIQVEGGAGADRLFGHGDGGELTGEPFLPPLWFEGNDGRDTLIGGAGSDSLWGGNDSDVIEGRGGNDYMEGDDGVDTVSYAAATTPVDVRLFENFNHGAAQESDTLYEFENVVGGPKNDYLIGSDGPNTITSGGGEDEAYGRAGADTLRLGTGKDTAHGGNGPDRLFGEGGTDRISGGPGADRLDGGAAIDTIFYLDGGLGIDVDLAPVGGGAPSIEEIPTATQTASVAAGDTIFDIEAVEGTIYRDILRGSDTYNLLDGRDGNDRLVGRGGADGLVGGPGTDTVDYSGAPSGVTVKLGGASATASDQSATGGGGSDLLQSIEDVVGSPFVDILTGNKFRNRLYGGEGNDKLYGWAEDDKLFGQSGTDYFDGGDGTDSTDAVAGETKVGIP